MKKVDIERSAIERALRSERNITEAAHALGSSRRTLQSRMRDYHIEPGKPGRPRALLPYAHRPLESLDTGAFALALIGAIGGITLAIYFLKRKAPVAVAGVARKARGLDLLGAAR